MNGSAGWQIMIGAGAFMLLVRVIMLSFDRAQDQRERRMRSRMLRSQCLTLVSIDRAQTVSGQAFADFEGIAFMRSILDFEGLPPVIKDHPHWWRRR